MKHNFSTISSRKEKMGGFNLILDEVDLCMKTKTKSKYT